MCLCVYCIVASSFPLHCVFVCSMPVVYCDVDNDYLFITLPVPHCICIVLHCVWFFLSGLGWFGSYCACIVCLTRDHYVFTLQRLPHFMPHLLCPLDLCMPQHGWLLLVGWVPSLPCMPFVAPQQHLPPPFLPWIRLVGGTCLYLAFPL